MYGWFMRLESGWWPRRYVLSRSCTPLLPPCSETCDVSTLPSDPPRQRLKAFHPFPATRFTLCQGGGRALLRALPGQLNRRDGFFCFTLPCLDKILCSSGRPNLGMTCPLVWFCTCMNITIPIEYTSYCIPLRISWKSRESSLCAQKILN
jgi:hypothetical protein